MKQLVCDLSIQQNGHNLGFVRSLIHFLNWNAAIDQEVTFLFNAPVEHYLNAQPEADNIQIRFITAEEDARIEACRTPLARRNAEWELIRQYAVRLGVQEVIIMDLDRFQLAVGQETTPFRVSGIYIRPHFRIEPIGTGLSNRLKYWFWRQKKFVLEAYMCRNRSLHRIFILNDQRAVEAMNQSLANVFRYLPDPIFDYPSARLDIHEHYGIDKQRCVFLIFGSIDPRKNIENILTAFGQLSAAQARQASLLIVGRINKEYRPVLAESLNQIQSQQPDLQVIVDDRFVGDGEMEALFAQCDVPLLVYRDFFVSSGLLGVAAKYNKPVLVSAYGVMAELTQAYQLGECVSPKDIEGLTSHLATFIERPGQTIDGGTRFYKSHRPEAFAATLLGLPVPQPIDSKTHC